MTIVIHTIRAGDHNGYALVRGRQTLLIDCPFSDAETLAKAGIPAPAVILHTQVQEEHCREWAAFPQAEVYVPKGTADLAQCNERFRKDARTVWPPDRPWDPVTMGMETYSLAGALTERPPRHPLHVAGELVPGTVFSWEGVDFEIIALPGHGRHSVGFHWKERGLLFSGDLMLAGGYPVNLYDLERGYGIKRGHQELMKSARAVMRRAPSRMLPATGAAIEQPVPDAMRLLERLGRLVNPGPVLFRQNEPGAQIGYTPVREFGMFRQVMDGVYQNNTYGNMVFFIDSAGRALLVDPDPCVWKSWEENCRIVHEQLDILEREAGLKRIELVLITHYHGDHIQYCDLLRKRYGSTVCAPCDVASVMEHPERFAYPAMVDWYGFPFTSVAVDRRLVYNRPIDWNGMAVKPIHTPGHCFAHASYSLTWQGRRVVVAGDVLQRGTGPIAAPGIGILYNDAAPPHRHARHAFERMAAEAPEVVLGGHGHCFFDEDGSVMRELCRAAAAGDEALRDLVAGDLERACTPPHFDAIRPVIVTD